MQKRLLPVVRSSEDVDIGLRLNSFCVLFSYKCRMRVISNYAFMGVYICFCLESLKTQNSGINDSLIVILSENHYHLQPVNIYRLQMVMILRQYRHKKIEIQLRMFRSVLSLR